MTKRFRKPGSGAARRAAEPTAAAPALRVLSSTPVHIETGRESPRPITYRNQPWGGYTDIGWADVVGALRAAELGQTERLVDLSRRMLGSDAHLMSVYETRINAVAGARWQLQPGRAKAGQEAIAERAAEDCTRMLEDLGNTERLFADILDAWWTHLSVHEIVWQHRGDMIVPVDLVWMHPRRFRWSPDYSPLLYDDGQAVGYAWAKAEGRVDASGWGVTLAPGKYLVHVPRPLPNYPPTSGLCVSVLRSWWRKMWAVRSWLAGAGIAGNPRAIGKYPSNGTDAQMRNDLQSALDKLSATGSVSISSDAEINIVPPSTQGADGVWGAQVRECDAGMSKAILGSTLNVDVGDTGGNRALGESQYDVTIVPRLRRDARSMWSTLEAQLLRPYLYLNAHRYGGQMPPLPVGESIVVEGEVEVDDLVVSSGKVTVNQLLTSRGLDPLPADQGGESFVPAPAAGGGAPLPFGASQTSPLSSSPRRRSTVRACRQVTRR